MNSIKIITQETTGVVHITSDAQYNNLKADIVILSENVTARLYGNIKHTVKLKKGSTLYLHGKLEGQIENEGGRIHIY
jgi:hypothetical protein